MNGASFQPLSPKGALSCQLADRRLNVWEGAVRSSKTVASIIAWIKFCRTAPPGPLVMVGKTRDTIQRNVIDVIISMIGQRALYNRGTGELRIMGRLIYVIGANDAQAETKVRGLTLVGAYCDELTILPEAFFKMLMTRLSLDGARLYGTTNPDNRRHWLKRDYLDRARVWLQRDGQVVMGGDDSLDLARFSFQLADNQTLGAEYLAALNAEYRGLWRKRFILGDWVMAEGAIYDMWDEDRMVVPHASIPPIERMLCAGVDYGTRNPFAAVLLGVAQGTLYAIDQYRWDSAAKLAQRTSGQYSADLKAWLAPRPPEWIYVDPAAAEFRRQLFEDGHSGVLKADNAVVDGIRTVSTLLGLGKLLVSDRCGGIIDTISGYAWDDKAALKGEEKPIKDDDHDLDALRYGVHSSAWLWRHPLGVTEAVGSTRKLREMKDAA